MRSERFITVNDETIMNLIVEMIFIYLKFVRIETLIQKVLHLNTI